MRASLEKKNLEKQQQCSTQNYCQHTSSSSLCSKNFLNTFRSGIKQMMKKGNEEARTVNLTATSSAKQINWIMV